MIDLHPKPLCKPFGVSYPDTRKPENKVSERQKHTSIIHKNKQQKKGNGFGFQVIRKNRPSPTLPKTCARQTSASRYIDQNGDHWLPSEFELKCIGSFPKQYQFTGKYSNMWARIGNSVPPLMMRSIAANISNILFNGKVPMKFDKNLTYPQILDLAWNEHLAPRADNAPTVISTFAGGGGSSLGYSMAGYRELLAVEMDNNAVATFKLNFPNVPIYHGDIAKLSAKECMSMAGLSGAGELDVFEGSPPCQGVSVAGKRDFNDPRNQLFREFVRLLRGLKPKVFIMENVSGLVKGKMKVIFSEIMRELKASGYQVRCKLLNAKYFYVPQSRQRLIFIGVRNDIDLKPSYPKAQSEPIAVIDAIGDIKTSMAMTAMQKKIWGRTLLGKAASKTDPKGHWFGFYKLDPNKPSPTILKRSGTQKLRWDSPHELTTDSYKRLQSMPDSFELTGAFEKRKARIGNSVPPLMMRSIANHVKQNLL